jgi:hypothetical protein
MRALYGASAEGALPAAVGSMRSPGIFNGLAALGLSISDEQGGGSPMSAERPSVHLCFFAPGAKREKVS